MMMISDLENKQFLLALQHNIQGVAKKSPNVVCHFISNYTYTEKRAHSFLCISFVTYDMNHPHTSE